MTSAIELPHHPDLVPYLDADQFQFQFQFRDNVHGFVQRHATPDYVRACDEKKRFPEELIRRMVEQGWFAVTLPEEYGGIGGYMAAMLEMISNIGCFVWGAPRNTIIP